MGIYVSGHPLAEYEEMLKQKINCVSKDFLVDEEQNIKIFDGQRVTIGGMIIHKSVKHTRAGTKMAFVTLEDLSGTIEVVVFSNVYEKVSRQIQEDAVVIVKGRASISAEGETKLIASQIDFLNTEGEPYFVLGLVLEKQSKVNLQDIIKVLLKHHGSMPVYIDNRKTGQMLKADSRYWFEQSALAIQELELLLGDTNVIVKNKNI